MCSGGAHTYEKHVCRLSSRWTPRCTVLEWQTPSELLPGPTHPTRHMQDPLVGEPQATPLAFSVPSHFTPSAASGSSEWPRCSSVPPPLLRTSRWLLGSALPGRCRSMHPPSTTQRWVAGSSPVEPSGDGEDDELKECHRIRILVTSPRHYHDFLVFFLHTTRSVGFTVLVSCSAAARTLSRIFSSLAKDSNMVNQEGSTISGKSI